MTKIQFRMYGIEVEVEGEHLVQSYEIFRRHKKLDFEEFIRFINWFANCGFKVSVTPRDGFIKNQILWLWLNLGRQVGFLSRKIVVN